MNIYSTEFFANCPNNGIRIKYHLTIETEAAIRVEDIMTSVEAIDDAFHEEIAAELHAQLGGRHTLVADHHGVRITTVRP